MPYQVRGVRSLSLSLPSPLLHSGNTVSSEAG